MKREEINSLCEKALLQLLNNKSYYKITVNDIALKAGISRATFYRKFDSLDSLLDLITDDLFIRCFDKTEMKKDNIKDSITAVFTNIEKEKETINILQKRGLLYKFHGRLYQKTLSEIIKLDVLCDPYQPYFFAGASSSFISAWILRDFKGSPKELATIFINSLKGHMTL